MPRATNAPASRRRRKREIKLASGYYGARHNRYRTVIESVRTGLSRAFQGRKKRKTTFRSLWITRLGIATKAQGVSYSQFIKGLALAKIEINRKFLSDMAINDKEAFDQIVAKVKAVLKKA